MHRSELSTRDKKRLSILSFVILGLFWIAVMYFIGRPMLRFVDRPEQFRAWVKKGGFLSRIAFIGMVVLQIIVAVIPGEPLELGAGYAFGVVEGTILCIIADFIGGIIVFALVRTWGVRLVEVFFSREKIRSLRFLKNQKKVNVLTYLIFILPGTPKDLLSYVVGLTDMHWGTWLMITSIARIPSVITSTYCGSAVGSKEYKVAIITTVITLILSLLGWLIYRIICKHHQKSNGV